MKNEFVDYNQRDAILRTYLSECRSTGINKSEAARLINMHPSCTNKWDKGHKPSARATSAMLAYLQRNNIKLVRN